MGDLLIVERFGPVLKLTLNRPEVRNAFNEDLIESLHQALSNLEPTVRAVVLTGEGVAFCAGGDLDWMRRASELSIQQNQADALRLARLFQKIVDCPAPVIARVNGAAFGGGCGLIAAADVAISVESAQFAFSEVRLGLIPATISPFVLNKIGPSHARHLFSTGEMFPANHALRIGLVHDVVSEQDLDSAVNRRIKAILNSGPKAVSSAKRLAAAPILSLESAAEVLALVRASPEAQEGISAFLEKRSAGYVVPWP